MGQVQDFRVPWILFSMMNSSFLSMEFSNPLSSYCFSSERILFKLQYANYFHSKICNQGHSKLKPTKSYILLGYSPTQRSLLHIKFARLFRFYRRTSAKFLVPFAIVRICCAGTCETFCSSQSMRFPSPLYLSMRPTTTSKAIGPSPVSNPFFKFYS